MSLGERYKLDDSAKALFLVMGIFLASAFPRQFLGQILRQFQNLFPVAGGNSDMYLFLGKSQSSFFVLCSIVLQTGMIFFSFQPNTQSLFVEEREHPRGEARPVPYQSLVSDQFRGNAGYDPFESFFAVEMNSPGIGGFVYAFFC